jgi:HK97 family phage major capsid protein
MLKALMERRAALHAALEALHRAAVSDTGEARSFTAAETTEFDAGLDEIRKLDERIEQLQDAEKRAEAAAAHRVSIDGGGERTAGTVVNEPEMYVKGGQSSFFRDLFNSTLSRDSAASERLRRHAVYASESRAVGNTNGAGGSGGEWAPPTWLTSEWINLIRPSRVTADLFKHEDVPTGTSSLNYPKLLTGTAVGLQTTQNSALPSTDPTTGFVQTGFATIGGKNVISQQLIDQGRNFDQVIAADLAAAYAQQVGTQVFTGAGTGTGTNAVVNGLGAATIGSTQTWTQATPTPAGFYGQTGSLLSAFLTKRLMPPTCWVMSPRRWYWLESSVDSTGRPLVVPNGPAYNPLATENGVVPMGPVGTFHGLPVVIDPLVPINLGAGTNQDIVYLLKTDDLVLLESAPQTEVFRAPYADTLGVLFRLYAYVGAILNRHPESIGVLTGTGLVTPTFSA